MRTTSSFDGATCVTIQSHSAAPGLGRKKLTLTFTLGQSDNASMNWFSANVSPP